jgi:hypothetical protein
MSPLHIADEARNAFSTDEEEPAFTFIRDAHLRLLAAGKEPRLDPCLKMAAFALAGFGERILEDLTRAVPWDQKASLGEARKRAIGLLKASFRLLEDVDTSNWARFFCELGELRSQYELLIDDLNARDRELMIGLPEALI